MAIAGRKLIEQRAIKARIQQASVDIANTRLLMFADGDNPILTPFLLILIVWLVVIFASFGMNAPRNGTVVVAFVVCSLAIGGAIFLILEMDRPLDGVMQISSWPMRNALAQMNW